MAEQFFTLVTNIGKAKIANANVLGTKVNFATLKIGDSNGTYYEPTETQEDLIHTVWSGNISSISIDPNNPNWIVIDTIIPSDVGGFTIREAGIFDTDGNMVAVAKYPETYKPVAENGATKDLTIEIILEVSNASAVTLKIDPSVMIATKKDFTDLAGSGHTTETVKKNAEDIASLNQTVNSHLEDNTKHVPYAVSTNNGNDYSVTIPNLTLSDGLEIRVKFNAASTAATTINVNNLGAKGIIDYFGNAVTNIKAGLIANLAYNSDTQNFILQGKGGGGNATASDIQLGKTATTDAGEVIGTNTKKYGAGDSISSSNLGLGSMFQIPIAVISDWVYAFCIDSSTGDYIIASLNSSYLYRFDQSGVLIQKTSCPSYINKIATDSLGNVYALCYGNSNTLYKFNSNFVLQWQLSLITDCTNLDLKCDASNNVYAICKCDSYARMWAYAPTTGTTAPTIPIYNIMIYQDNTFGVNTAMINIERGYAVFAMSDYNDGVLRKYNLSNGVLIKTGGTAVDNALTMGIDSSDNIYLAFNTGTSINLQKYDSNCNLLYSVATNPASVATGISYILGYASPYMYILKTISGSTTFIMQSLDNNGIATDKFSYTGQPIVMAADDNNLYFISVSNGSVCASTLYKLCETLQIKS